ncbi:hypothetical protein X798_07118 [Onchocerca flexuosa]|uniref:Uncharacterized protein n=1 Tax=Onchocerca flexuosa TaxID=387005 RepID=A0A238BLH3_9BILA|nr:hypothetical protein X798_07118 [Onchocerca flexuosa]
MNYQEIKKYRELIGYDEIISNDQKSDNRYSLMNLGRRDEYCAAYDVEYKDGQKIGNPEKVQPNPRKNLRDCLEDCSRQLDQKSSEVLFFMENSGTPHPDNNYVNFLSGRRIIARAHREIKRNSSFVNSKLVSI